MMADTGPASRGEDWGEWVGRQEVVRERVSAEKVAALAAALDLEAPPGRAGELPPGWHWIFFNPFLRRSGLGPDGHPRRGGFLPPVPLPRRMWAGGRISYARPVPVGPEAERRSEILKVETKSGKRGQLVFVTVRHTVTAEGAACLVEEQDVVYREAAPPGSPAPRPEPAPDGAGASQEVVPDPVLLFRYSALTSNGHRIHYDQPYATGEEGYRDLVVHGPLLATLLQGLAGRARPGVPMREFSFRGVAPVFADRPFRVEAGPLEAGPSLALWVKGPEGELAMQAGATFGPTG